MNHDFERKLARRFLRNERMRLLRVYLMQAEQRKTSLFSDEEKLSG